MNNKVAKAVIISLIMTVQSVLPVFAENVQNEEITNEQVELLDKVENDTLKEEDEAVNEEESSQSSDEEKTDNEFEVLEYEEEKKPVPSDLIATQKKNTLSVDIHIGAIKKFKLSKATFALYNKDFEIITEKSFFIGNTNVNHILTFDVPEYSVGEVFYLSCTEGVDCVKYKEDYFGVNHKIKLETLSDSVDQETDKQVIGNYFNLTAYPLADRNIDVVLNGYSKNLMFPAKIDDGTAIISFPDVVRLLGLEENEQYFYNSGTGEVDIALNEYGVILFVGKTEAYIKDQAKEITAPRIIDGIIYLPLRFVMEGLGATLDVKMAQDSMKVNVSLPSIKYIEQNKFISKQGIESKTNYLLWVSKSNFTVTVFVKTDKGWEAIKDMPCSIGAPATPTVVGQFEYFSKEKQWSYPGYYVGPIMRFYNGYAFHSTLIKYDGTPYDSRVGKQISHGCVRMRPEDINWMADTIPLYTKVYITN